MVKETIGPVFFVVIALNIDDVNAFEQGSALLISIVLTLPK